MFTSSDGVANFDSVLCVGAALAKPPNGEQPEIQLTMVYLKKATGTTFGTCPVQTHLLSQKTRDLALEFMASAEEDFGAILFGEGMLTEPGEPKPVIAGGSEEAKRKGLGWKG